MLPVTGCLPPLQPGSSALEFFPAVAESQKPSAKEFVIIKKMTLKQPLAGCSTEVSTQSMAVSFSAGSVSSDIPGTVS